MKAAKLIGERLIRYLTDGINWKDHKDIVLDYWIEHIAIKSGINKTVLKKVYYVDDMTPEHIDVYKKWFNEFDFQSEDKSWIKFIDGSLNIFYKTENPVELNSDEWFVYLTNSEEKVKKIVETQSFHGNPDINNFWKLTRNGKYEEVAGRNNGYLFTDKLSTIQQSNARAFKWAVVFQSENSVELEYLDGKHKRTKCINWASHCTNITLAKVSASGKLILVPMVIEKENRVIPDGKIRISPMTGTTLAIYLKKHFDTLYQVHHDAEEEEKQYNTGLNARKSAINTFTDEEVNVIPVINDIPDFILNGNVDDDTRLKNKEKREYLSKKRDERKRAVKRAKRELEKQKAKDLKRKLERFKGNLNIGFNQ